MLPLTVKLRAIDQAVSRGAQDDPVAPPPWSDRSRIAAGRNPGTTPTEVGKMKRALMRMLKMLMGKDGKSST
jgi:hypothetical protein